jgi:hypothetical protein
MRLPVKPAIRTERPTGAPGPEVARARALYMQALKARVRDGSYFTDRRVETALRRLLAAVREDLPGEA